MVIEEEGRMKNDGLYHQGFDREKERALGNSLPLAHGRESKVKCSGCSPGRLKVTLHLV